MDRRAISPIISAVLLIMIVVVLAIIIIGWSGGFIKEKILVSGKPIESVCLDVKIETFVNDDNSFGFTNIGNVPIYAVDLKISDGWSSTVSKVEREVDAGFSTVIEGHTYDPDKEIKIIPILLGETESGKEKEFTCPEGHWFVV